MSVQIVARVEHDYDFFGGCRTIHRQCFPLLRRSHQEQHWGRRHLDEREFTFFEYPSLVWINVFGHDLNINSNILVFKRVV
jgi:hypothetical protein